MSKDEALKMALEFLEAIGSNYWGNRKVVITAIKEALAEPEQELDPVATLTEVGWIWDGDPASIDAAEEFRRLLTSPPKEPQSCDKRQPLTDDEIYCIAGVTDRDEMSRRMARNIARWTEAAHGIGETE